MRRTAVLAALVVAGALVLVACTTPYQPKGAGGGFTDKKLGAGHYSMEFSGNGKTAAELVANMFLYR
ncbi:MAG: hypothetical protein NVS2B4_12340 [Ramlibacter sp.]